MQHATESPIVHVSRLRVLIVNDDVRFAHSVAQFLIEEGYGARVACDGTAANQTLREWPADLIILDLFMRRLDGFRFLYKWTETVRSCRCLLSIDASVTCRNGQRNQAGP